MYRHTIFLKSIFAIRPNSQNFYITKCSPLKCTGLILNEITTFFPHNFRGMNVCAVMKGFLNVHTYVNLL